MPVFPRLLTTRRLASTLTAKAQFPIHQSLLTKSIRLFGTKQIFNCPEAGEGQTEIDILEWHVKPGDKVKIFDVIGRGKYEKADIDIISPYDGVVTTLFVDAGNVATIHKPLIEFEVEGSADSNASNASNTSNASQTPSDTSASSSSSSATSASNAAASQALGSSGFVTDGAGGPILTTPAVRRIAKENNINLANVPGTGKEGRILKEDIINFMEGNGQSAPITQQKTQSTQMKQALQSAPIAPKAAQDHVEKIIGVKRAMVKKMTEAAAVPMFGYGDEINMSALVALRKELKPIAEKQGIKLSYMPFIIKAVSMSLQSYTCLNGHVSPNCDELIHRASHNIGVAVDSPEGLIVPNIKNCQAKSITQIASDLDGLIQRARKSQVTNDDITGGTFTLSNIGAIGGTYCRPICFVPEVCIGALGAFQMVPRYDANNELIPTPMMAVSWSADHRVIDGATVARFSNEWKQYLENPGSMLLNLQ